MNNSEFSANGITRRDVLKSIATGAFAATFGSGVSDTIAAATQATGSGGGRISSGAYNILFIFTDQERYFRPGELPKDFRLPAHERLARNGIVFDNHRINSCVCTLSRSVLYTGHIFSIRRCSTIPTFRGSPACRRK